MLTVDSGQWKDIKFLRMDYIKNYNFTMAMGHVDLSDQLRGSYQINCQCCSDWCITNETNMVRGPFYSQFWRVGVGARYVYFCHNSFSQKKKTFQILFPDQYVWP